MQFNNSRVFTEAEGAHATFKFKQGPMTSHRLLLLCCMYLQVTRFVMNINYLGGFAADFEFFYQDAFEIFCFFGKHIGSESYT